MVAHKPKYMYGVGEEADYLSFNLEIQMFNFEKELEKNYAQRGARTHDPEIKSLMLYRLS